MIIEFIKNIIEFIKLKYFKNGQVGFKEILIIALSLVTGFIVLLLIVRMLHVGRSK